jgi:lipid-A-disaccharide synthase
VIKRLRAQAPGLTVFGAGGPKMKAAGMELLLDLTEHAVVGLVEVLKNYGKFRRIFNELLAEVERRKPDAIVLVDFPGFNLRFAKAVRKIFSEGRASARPKILYYISPQLWAWHASRAKQIERDVDLMLCIFPFEKDWYAKHAPKLKVEFVGHPFADCSSVAASVPDAAPSARRRDGGLYNNREEKLVLLLPGSREREVAAIWPVMRRVVDVMPGELQFVSAAVNEQMAAMMKHPRVKVEIGSAQGWMQRAALAITASGTATMECAFYGCPMVVVYKVNWLTYLVGRMLVTVNWLAMPNVIAGRAIVPEFIQHEAKPERVALAAQGLLDDKEKRELMQRELAAVVGTLGGPGASERAAKFILATNGHE